MKMLIMMLQVFADLNVQTTLLKASGNDLSPEMKTFYDMTLIDEAQSNLVHQQFGQKRPIPKNGGKVIEFRKFDALPKATTPITEGVTPNGRSLNVTAVTAEVKQYGDYITQSDVLELTALDNTILEATKLLGRQAGLTLDTIVREVMQGTTNVSYCPSKADPTTEISTRTGLKADSVLTVDAIKRAVAKLRAQNAPPVDGKYYVAIIHPYVAYDLMSDEHWEDASKYGAPDQLFEGEIGRVAGVRFVETTEAKIYTTGTPTGLAVFGTLIMGRDAYGVTEVTGGGLQTIVKQKGSAGTADPLDQRSSVGWKAMITAEVLLPQYLLRLESTSAFSKTAKAN